MEVKYKGYIIHDNAGETNPEKCFIGYKLKDDGSVEDDSFIAKPSESDVKIAIDELTNK